MVYLLPLLLLLCAVLCVQEYLLFYNSYLNGGNKPPGVRRRPSNPLHSMSHRIHRPDHHRRRCMFLLLL